MKKVIMVSIAAYSLMMSQSLFAQDKAEDHSAHHPDGQAQSQPAEKADSSAKGSEMGSMKMDDMMGMMKECMAMHKDGKMCEHNAMEKCQANMDKGDCGKMMKRCKSKMKAKKS